MIEKLIKIYESELSKVDYEKYPEGSFKRRFYHKKFNRIKSIIDSLVIDLELIGDDNSLEGYSLKKINQNKYQVLVNDVPKYELEKKGQNWHCTCTGYKYRQRCKHLNLLEDIIPKRHKREKIDEMIPEINKLMEGYDRWDIVGSYRRGAPDFKDIDIIVECDKNEFSNLLPRLKKDENYEHTMAGPDIIRGKYKGYLFDITRVEPGEYGPYLLYRTGSKDFNLRMRGLAKAKGLMLNEHGLFKRDTKELITNGSEKEIMNALGMEYVEPQNRN